jgi:hypothetical protein
MQRNNTNNIVVTNEVKVFIGKLGLWVRKLEAKSLYMFSRLKDFMGRKQVTLELISVSKISWLICSPGF